MKVHEIFEQVAGAEHRAALAGALGGVRAYQRNLVDHEEGVPGLVGRERKAAAAVGAHGLLAVDMLVDRGSRTMRGRGKHLGGAARRSQQHRLRAHLVQYGDRGRNRRGLTGAGIAVDHEDVRVVAGHEIGEAAEKPGLAGGGLVAEALDETRMEEVRPAHLSLLSKIIPSTARTGYISTRPRNMSKEKISFASVGALS